MRFGFIGLGAMGQPMAQNISRKMARSDSLYVFDLVKSRANVGIALDSPSAVASGADTIVTMLPDGKHVASAFDEILSRVAGQPPKLFVDSSTIDIATSQAVAERVAQAGHTYIDAPVSGGVLGAKNGTLTFMVGADNLARIKPVLQMMGRRIFSCGHQSAGLAAKLANNYILALNNLSTSEGFRLAEKLGLDMATFSELVNVSSGQSWSTTVNNPVPGIDAGTPSSRNYDGGFAVNLCKKDLSLAVDAAEKVQLQLPLGSHAPEVYQRLSDDGYGHKDFSVVYKALAS